MKAKLDFQFKIAFVGSGSVGKTSSILRFTTNTFRENYIPTLGVGFARKIIDVDNQRVSLQIWDMGAQEHLGKIRANYFGGASGVVFVYDLTKRETFEEIMTWKDEVDEHLSSYCALVIANKMDLKDERIVTTEEGIELSLKLNGEYIETSAKTGYNIDEAFKSISRQGIKMIQERYE